MKGNRKKMGRKCEETAEDWLKEGKEEKYDGQLKQELKKGGKNRGEREYNWTEIN